MVRPAWSFNGVSYDCDSGTWGIDCVRLTYLGDDPEPEDWFRGAPNSETPDAPRCTALAKRAHGRLLASAANLSI